jgi:hypothetical protein
MWLNQHEIQVVKNIMKLEVAAVKKTILAKVEVKIQLASE